MPKAVLAVLRLPMGRTRSRIRAPWPWTSRAACAPRARRSCSGDIATFCGSIGVAMLLLFRDVTVLAARRAVRTWPVALSFLVYAVILLAAGMVAAPFGMIGGLV